MHNGMNTYGVMEVSLQAFLTPALNRGEKSASHPSRFTPGERTPDTHWTGD